MPHMNQGISHPRHDDELGAGTDEDIQRALSQNLEVVGGQGQTHSEHDDAKHDGLSSSAHPVEGMWEEECEYCYTYYENRGVISTVHDDLVARGLSLFLWTFAVVFCHNTLGYLLGWLAGKLAGFNTAKKRTISIEVGMQNAGLATVLAGNFFAAQPLAVLPCAISCAWHSISGTILAGIYLKWDHMHEKK